MGKNECRHGFRNTEWNIFHWISINLAMRERCMYNGNITSSAQSIDYLSAAWNTNLYLLQYCFNAAISTSHTTDQRFSCVFCCCCRQKHPFLSVSLHSDIINAVAFRSLCRLFFGIAVFFCCCSLCGCNWFLNGISFHPLSAKHLHSCQAQRTAPNIVTNERSGKTNDVKQMNECARGLIGAKIFANIE